jgi:hypothetical protein
MIRRILMPGVSRASGSWAAYAHFMVWPSGIPWSSGVNKMYRSSARHHPHAETVLGIEMCDRSVQFEVK